MFEEDVCVAKHFSRNRIWIVASILLGSLMVIGVALGSGRLSAESVSAETTANDVFVPLVATALLPPNRLTVTPYATLGITTHTPTVTDIAHAGDGRLFIAERSGLIKIIMPGGATRAQPFLDISHLVKGYPDVQANWEEGLLGLAFHPDYATNGYFYVAYTGANPTYPVNGESYQIILRRFRVSDSDPNVANPMPDPQDALMIINKPSVQDESVANHSVHNGGDLNFGPDGYLYMSVGDGGPDPLDPDDPNYQIGDPYNHGQSLDVALAKILRIDVDQTASTPPDANRCARGRAYAIPSDNPFADGAGGNCDEIWAYGLRNPWRFSFDRATGDMYIADVGEWEFEEVDYQPANSSGGANYGWHCWQGFEPYVDCEAENYVPPLLTYPTGGYGECSITGGYVYRGSEMPGLNGYYIYGDFCTGRMWITAYAGAATTATEIADIQNNFLSTYGEDINGELYVGGFFSNTVYKIVKQ
ncbi:MAG: PQQ-dependent sugar dehydrogenase [Anaerolineae bacterium]|nr:PQQ-dependent sugar dehydrogenase [Anaerolineae bacterium]